VHVGLTTYAHQHGETCAAEDRSSVPSFARCLLWPMGSSKISKPATRQRAAGPFLNETLRCEQREAGFKNSDFVNLKIG
jgi:hypothetical protein